MLVWVRRGNFVAMPDQPMSLEFVKSLQETKEQLRQTMYELSQVRSEYKDLVKLVSSAENERSILQRLWTLEQSVDTLRAHTTTRQDRGWQITTLVLGALISMAISLSVQTLKPQFNPEPSPSPLEEPYLPPGEGEPGAKL